MWRALVLISLPSAALSDSLVAARVIKAQTQLVAEDLALVAAHIPGALTDPEQAIGQEARVSIYPGRPVLSQNIGPAAKVDRNQTVTLRYVSNGLSIRTEGRALERGGVGDHIEVMNLVSRAKISGRIERDGSIVVGSPLTP